MGSRSSLKEIVNKIVIKDRIQRVYAACASEMVALRQFKRKHGYCAGSPSCMEYTGEGSLCRRCQLAKASPKTKKPVWEYGQLRAKEKQHEREQAAKKKTAPRRKAA